MSLWRTMNVGATGLRVSQAGLATVGNNLANVDVRGYSRQRIELAGNPPVVGGSLPSWFGQGARLDTVSRAHDPFIERQVLRDRTLAGFYEGRARTLEAVERLYVGASDPDVGAALDGFFNAARELSQNAGDRAVRLGYLQAAESVAAAFRALDRDLRTTQRGVDDVLNDRIGKINELTGVVAEMNARIVAGELDQRQANDFRDRRDQAVRELSTLVDVNVMNQADGSVSVALVGDYMLVQGDRTARLQGTPNPANQRLIDVEYVGLNGQVTNLTQRLTEGEVGGLLDVRDRVLNGDLGRLDQLAFELANAVNAVHQAGFGLDGVGGRDLFTPPVGVAFSAANLTVDIAMVGQPDRVAAAQNPALLPGDNRNALLLADLQNVPQVALGNTTFGRRWGELLYGVGSEAAGNADRLEVQRVRADQSEALRDSVAGVSVDDEMIDLTRYQKHFEASTRVISTVDRLLDAVLALVQ